ncbi:MAG: CTP synthase [Candidatus Kariarchaeaceae archaeon]
MNENLSNFKTKIIIVTGGVMSGIGKGIVCSSIGMLLKTRGFKVDVMKADPYLHVDPGTMNPTEHGEIFVTEKVWSYEYGEVVSNIAELDQDFGNYERFMDINVHPSHNLTSGQIFMTVLNKERELRYAGKTVQMIPHVTDEIKRRIYQVIAEKEGETDFLIIEIGGTTGDIEGDLYLETARQLFREHGKEKMCLIHTTWIPYNAPVCEFKTKPTQHSISLLFSKGIFPDFVVCRSESQVDEAAIRKIALYSNLKEERIISNPNLDNIYKIPTLFEEQDFCMQILSHFNVQPKANVRLIAEQLKKWDETVNLIHNVEKTVVIGLGGKYFDHKDTYYSVREALMHAGVANKCKVIVKDLNVEKVTEETSLKEFDGILVPGGFGERGAEGKIKLAEKCISEKIPYLGICYGMQLAVVAVARKLCGLEKANSIEVDPETPDPVINFVKGQEKIIRYGGTMRLGSYDAILEEGTIVSKCYNNEKVISERHRHRLEVNFDYLEVLKQELIFSGVCKQDENIVEFIELPQESHPFFVGTQAHPEFKSRLRKPSPLYVGFIAEASKKSKAS